MIQSLIEPTVEYVENRDILKRDVGYNAPYFEVELFKNKYGNIALGKGVEYKMGLLCFPVYHIEEGFATEQIGIYEINKSDHKANIDSDGDLDIRNLPDPLPLYNSSFTNDYLYEKQLKINDSLETQEILDSTTPTELDETMSYSPVGTDSWIQRYMKNSKYGLFDVEAQGDCFFATIREAYKTVGREESVDDLRKIVSNAADHKTFDTYKEYYTLYKNDLKSNKKKIKEIGKNVKKIREILKTKITREEKVIQIESSKKLKAEYDTIILDIKATASNLDEWKWFENISNIEDLKKIMLKPSYWADDWAINTIELKLNIKMIILSEENYIKGDVDNVMNCGNVVPDEITRTGKFEPDHYIIISHSGNHYKLIKYKKKALFKFKDIPDAINELIMNKCMEKNSGMFSFIGDFKNLKTKQGGGKISTDKNKLQFHINSNDNKAGKGPNEKIQLTNIGHFNDLDKIKNWRKILSNQYETTKPLNIDGRKWKTITHYYNSQKFIEDNKNFSDLFSLDSMHYISKDVKMAIAAGSKSGKYKKNTIRHKKIQIDKKFSKNKKNILYKALLEKFKQDDLSKKVLLNTKDAVLYEFEKGKQPSIASDIMKIRELLRI